MNIHEIIKENIKHYIFESLSTQKQKYGSECVNQLKNIDPTKTYKYIDFICKLYNDGISEEEIKKYIDIYNEKLNRNLIDKEHRDINKFKNFDEFKNYIDSIKDTISNTEIKKQYGDLNSPLVKKQYWKTITTDKGTWNVYIPNTMEQSIQIQSKDTTWCTQMENKYKNYFNLYRYIDSITLYYFVNMDSKTTILYNKQGEIVNDHQILMYQIQVYPDNKQYKIFNNNDERITKKQLYKETGINQDDYKWKQIPDGKYIKYYDNGKIKVEYNYKNGKLNGKYIEYWSNGNKFIECNYKDGKINGKLIYYKKNGDIYSIAEYKNGKIINGTKIIFYAKPDVHRIENYKNGKLDGDYIEFNINGKITNKKHYKNGEEDYKYII